MSTRNVVAAGIAAATAATAAGIVAVRRHGNGKSSSVYHVRPADEGWSVQADGAERASSRHRTKKEAVDAARRLATGQEGRLVIHRLDDTVQREYDYAAA